MDRLWSQVNEGTHFCVDFPDGSVESDEHVYEKRHVDAKVEDKDDILPAQLTR